MSDTTTDTIAPTIARAVTLYVMTDDTIRICETDALDLNTFNAWRPIFCSTPEEAFDYLRNCDVLSTNPAWFRK